MRMFYMHIGVVFMSSIVWEGAATAAPVGNAFTYQGRLKVDGSPANGVYDLQFALYDQLNGGTQQGGTVCADNVAVAEGLFTQVLDFGAQFAGQERFLEIAVRADSGLNCGNLTGFVALSPRQALTGTPYSHFALNADQVDGQDSSTFLQSIPMPLTLSGSSAGSHVIRGENASATSGSTGVRGVSTAATGGVYGGRFESSSISGRGLLGWATSTSGTTYGVYALNDSTSGRGVFGWATASSGTNYGVYGQSDSPDGRGAYGRASAATGTSYGGYFESASASGTGLKGLATAAAGANYGVYGTSNSTAGTGVRGEALDLGSGQTFGGWFASYASGGRGVYAYASQGSGIAVYGESAGTNGRGVQGMATATSGSTFGGRFESASTNGRGVQGMAAATSGTTYGGRFESFSSEGRGVYGWAAATTGTTFGGSFENDSTSGRAVFGRAYAASGTTYGGYFQSDSTTGRGVYARANGGSGTIYGVYGSANVTGDSYGVFADGELGASGTKSFRIDHPQDPENKYLLHYSAESPEVINFYSGKVTLDQQGAAVVELPAYFASINKDPRYTLTAVGAPMPNLHVAKEISEEALATGEQAGPGVAPPICSFRIAGGVPAGKVSWRVEALRNDLRVRLHGAPVEREKIGRERGKYQHPEYYGLSPEKGMDFDATDASTRSQAIMAESSDEH